jgi:hypothetical protein
MAQQLLKNKAFHFNKVYDNVKRKIKKKISKIFFKFQIFSKYFYFLNKISEKFKKF